MALDSLVFFIIFEFSVHSNPIKTDLNIRLPNRLPFEYLETHIIDYHLDNGMVRVPSIPLKGY